MVLLAFAGGVDLCDKMDAGVDELVDVDVAVDVDDVCAGVDVDDMI